MPNPIQSSEIAVPRSIRYKENTPEESCWAMPPYANLYPQPADEEEIPPPSRRTQPLRIKAGNVLQAGRCLTGTMMLLASRREQRTQFGIRCLPIAVPQPGQDWLPPVFVHTDLASANQTYPL